MGKKSGREHHKWMLSRDQKNEVNKVPNRNAYQGQIQNLVVMRLDG